MLVFEFKVKRIWEMAPKELRLIVAGARSTVPPESVPLSVWVQTVCQVPSNTSANPGPVVLSRSQANESVALVSGAARVRVIWELGLPPYSSMMAPGFTVLLVVQSALQPVPPDHVTELKSSTEDETEASAKVAVRLVSLVGKRNGFGLVPVNAPLHPVNTHPGAAVACSSSRWPSAKSSPLTGE